jgi:cytochrome c556
LKLESIAVLALILISPCYGQSTLAEHMGEHYAKATQVQTAVINADLGAAKEAAAWLAGHTVDDAFPENALDEMRFAAQEVVDADNIHTAAKAVGLIGAACGHCHQLMSIKPDLKSSIDYRLGDTLPERMSRHLWAADRMWAGLITNSDQAWKEGAEMLLEAPLKGEDVTGDTEAAIDYIGALIRDLAIRARAASKREQRAELYGEFVARCSSCHAGFRGNRSN